MDYEDLPQAVRHAVGVHEGLRRLGFAASEIFAGTRGDDVIVTLRSQGRELNMKVGAHKGITYEQFQGYWQLVGDAMSRGEVSNELSQRIYFEAPIVGNSVKFVSGLLAAGFTLPKIEEMRKIAHEESN